MYLVRFINSFCLQDKQIFPSVLLVYYCLKPNKHKRDQKITLAIHPPVHITESRGRGLVLSPWNPPGFFLYGLKLDFYRFSFQLE